MKTELIEKLESIKLSLEVHPDNQPNSEFEDRIDDLNEIIESLQPKEQLSADITDYQRLFDYMHIEHNVILLQQDMQEIARIVMHDFANNSELQKENQRLQAKLEQAGDLALKWFQQLEEIDNLKRQVELQKAQIDKFELDNLCSNANNSEAKWISIEDGLPEVHIPVIVSCEHGVTMATYTSFPNGNSLWWAVTSIGTYEDSTNADNITHWMSLPTPPNQ
ncbi:Domain of unknown function DUF551 [uncultured Caudovirales phage]|uniref:DUF551 domain-containing protein n=1 Tax=uncultured Caudovirales phage TaxID=2100421 RepID=A0A6J5SVP1_9CAUD|nr:Domain of unknown function DUF551 [uncultured Caudovirales phage]